MERLTDVSAVNFETFINQRLVSGNKSIMINLTAVEYAGVQVYRAITRAVKSGREVTVIVGENDQMRRYLDISLLSLFVTVK